MVRVAIGSPLHLHTGPSSVGQQATFKTQNVTKTEMVLYLDDLWVYTQFPHTSYLSVLQVGLT